MILHLINIDDYKPKNKYGYEAIKRKTAKQIL